MSSKVFQNILKSSDMPRERLRAMFMPADEPKIEQIVDEVERTIKHAINLASEGKPSQAMIMTSDAKRKAYENNEHFKSTKLVRLKSGNECLELLKSFYEQIERD